MKQLAVVEVDLKATEVDLGSRIEKMLGEVNENFNQFNDENGGFKEEIN